MSGFSITVEDAEIGAALDRLEASLGDLSAPMASIGQVLVTLADLSFRTQSDPWGRAWAALSRVTLKRRRGTTAHILRDTNRLANSLTYRAERNSVTVGTNVIYAAMQQFGGTREMWPHLWGDIPARPYLPIGDDGIDLPPDTAEDILDVIQIHAVAALQR